MKKNNFIFILGCCGLFLLSCESREKKETRQFANQLFDKSVSLFLEYQQKYKSAPDSLAVDSLSEIFEKQLVEINFSFPPETDLKLTEEENDSLFELARKLILIKNERLKELVPEPEPEPETKL